MVKIKSKQLTSGNEASGKVLSSDGVGGVGFNYAQVQKGSIFPTTPSNGDLFYYTSDNILYQYDNSRIKWLSVEKIFLTLGKGTISQNATGYLSIGNATFNSTTGILMYRNGTILSASVDNTNNLAANRDIEIRINNSTTNKALLTIANGNKSVSTTGFNIDFNINDLIQCVALPNNTAPALSNIIVLIEIAWRN